MFKKESSQRDNRPLLLEVKLHHERVSPSVGRLAFLNCLKGLRSFTSLLLSENLLWQYQPGTEFDFMVCSSVARDVLGPIAWFRFRVNSTLEKICNQTSALICASSPDQVNSASQSSHICRWVRSKDRISKLFTFIVYCCSLSNLFRECGEFYPYLDKIPTSIGTECVIRARSKRLMNMACRSCLVCPSRLFDHLHISTSQETVGFSD